MKKALLSLALSASVISSHSQGTITFFSANPIYTETGQTGVGAGFTAGLFLANDRTTPIGTTTFLTAGGEGYLNAIDVNVPGFATGTSNARFVVRVWETSAGSFLSSTRRGEFDGTANTGTGTGFTSGALGGPVAGSPPALPPDLGPNFLSFRLDIPEPSTYALGVLGLVALTMMRRR